MNLYVDDCKPVPEGFEAVARTFDDAVRLMRRYDYDVVSLDHDLADTHRPERTGHDLMVMIESGELRQPKVVLCHSWNPVGRARILAGIERWNVRRAASPREAPASVRGLRGA